MYLSPLLLESGGIQLCVGVSYRQAGQSSFSSDIGTLSCSHFHAEEWQVQCLIASGESHSYKGPNAS